ncbi:MAG TPA: AAA family ATPase, partial [Armatimonadota bacterium]
MSRFPRNSGSLFTAPAAAGGDEPVCLEGSLESITFRKEDTGFTIARLRTFDRELVTIIGEFLNPVPGESLQLWGKWEIHKQYGPQLRVERYQLLKPATVAGIEKYLGSGMIHGIGPGIAKVLVAHFGLDTLDVIEEHPERLSEAPGIGKERARWIAEAWEEQRAVRHIMLFLQGHGISASLAAKIYRTYGDRAIEIVTANPYKLAQDVYGIGFKTADRIARQLGVAGNTPERIEAGLLFGLRESSEQGHCFLPEALLVQNTVELLAAPAEEKETDPTDAPTAEAVSESLENLVRRQLLIRDTDDPGMKPIYLKRLYLLEHVLAQNLRRMLAEELRCERLPRDPGPFVDDLAQSLQITLAAQQRQAVIDSLCSRVLILTGGPGTGKTTTTQAILRAHLDCGRNVLLASPTGRAAKRLSEVTGYPAMTIHRLLEVDPANFQFKRGPENPLDCDLLIIDEMSMVDLHLAYSLVRALPDGAQLIIVGDADQLPSVGAGNILHDMIDSGEVPVVRLTEIFRQAAESAIITNAHKINSGEMPDLPPTSQWQSSD